MSNPNFSYILARYDETRRMNRDILMARFEEVYKLIPEYKEIEQEIVSLTLDTTKLMVAGGDNSLLATLRLEIDTLSQQKKVLLSSKNFPQDYLDDIVSCKDCSDTAYINNRPCHCFEKKLFDSQVTQSSLVNKLKDENFNSFDLNIYDTTPGPNNMSNRQIMENNLRSCLDFTANFDSHHKNLLLTGQVGAGKTFLSNCIADALMNQLKTVLYFSAIDFYDTAAKDRFSYDADKGQLLHQIYNCDLLIIDDLGTEVINQYTESQLFACVNERLNLNKSTLISTNLGLSSLKEKYKDRIFSRLLGEYETLIIPGADMRYKKKFQNTNI